MKKGIIFFILMLLAVSLFIQIFIKLPEGEQQLPQPQLDQLKVLTLKRIIDINSLRLGHNFPNILKGMYITVDETTGNIYLTGILTSGIYEVSSDSGKVLRYFDTELSGTHYVKLAISSLSKTLFYVTTDGRICSFDLKSGSKKGTYSYQGINVTNKNEKLIFPEIAVDKNSGFLLVLCREEEAIYVFNDQLSQIKKIKLTNTPISLCWSEFYRSIVVSSSEKGKSILKFSRINVDKGNISEIISIITKRTIPEKEFTIDEKGNFYLLGQALSCIDNKGKELWSIKIADLPNSMVYYKGVIALIFKDGHANKEEGGKPSCVDFYRAKDGKYISTTQVRFEAQNMALDKTHNNLCIGNGGDASVSIIDWNSRKLKNTYRVASSAEEVIYDKEKDVVYIMNRLGGSEIYRYNLKTGEFNTLIAGSWPVDMAFSPSRKKLYVMSHYEAKIYVIDTEKFEVIDKLSLGIIGSKSDTMSYMAFNENSGIIVAGFPETADLVILNVDSKMSKRIKPKGATPLFDEGPGEWHVQISNDGKYILLYIDKQGKLIQYDMNGKEIASVPVRLEPKTYNQEIFRILPSTKQIYLGPYPVNINPLNIGQPEKFIDRVLDIKDNIMFGNCLEEDGEETFVVINKKTNNIIASYKINKSKTIPSNCYFNLEEGVYFVTDMPKAKVYQFDVNIMPSIESQVFNKVVITGSVIYDFEKIIFGKSVGNVNIHEVGMPDIHIMEDGTWRMYYHVAQPLPIGDSIRVAVSNDGLNWIDKEIAIEGAKDDNDRMRAIQGPSVIKLLDGRYRLFTNCGKLLKTPGAPKDFHIRSAISNDGGYTFIDEGVVIDNKNGDPQSPWLEIGHGRVFRLKDNRLAGIFTVSDGKGPGCLALFMSKDEGLHWEYINKLYINFHDPAIAITPQGYYLLARYLQEYNVFAFSPDGINWPNEVIQLLLRDPTGTFADPKKTYLLGLGNNRAFDYGMVYHPLLGIVVVGDFVHSTFHDIARFVNAQHFGIPKN
ncbi:MAG: hypothetical protein QMD25_00235 [Caldisericia bacterium]|nr:hypothetical protein [Caldisericia bacterium]